MRKTVLVLASVALAMVLVSGVAWAAKIRCERGSTQNNPCHGTKNPDLIRGTIGRDHIIGWSSLRERDKFDDHDTIHGYAKNDKIYGGQGKDRLYGESGIDSMYGSYARDRLYGGTGDDKIDSGPYADKVRGGPGDDYLFSGPGGGGEREPGDWMAGDTGNDDIDGWTRDDTLYGGRGADDLWGFWGVDHLYGDAGPDTIIAEESDNVEVGDLDTRDFVSCGDGFDKVQTDDEGVDEIAADCEQIIYEPPFEE